VAKKQRERGSVIKALNPQNPQRNKRVKKKASIPEGESPRRACWCPDRELKASGQRVRWEYSNTVSYAEVICVEDITSVRAKAERHMGRALH
jgi:hypothetical protein